MKTINVGDTVKSIVHNTNHIVESIEIIDGKTFVFTEDIKCFPLEDIILQNNINQSSDLIFKFLDGKISKKEELKEFENVMSDCDIELFGWKKLSFEECLQLINAKKS